ncbi:MAG: choice-of-anchor M domain-containing protein [Verrucomicrobiaceae bacterium]|nr:choice-of-anchor M domain-containing protein [Verrucomicrobiaceae bacterium]
MPPRGFIPSLSLLLAFFASGLSALQAQTAPTISDVANRSTLEGTATSSIAITIGDAETAAASLVLTGSSSNTTLVPNANLVFGGSGTSRTLIVTPAAGQSGTATITLTVTDGDLMTASDSFVLTVNPLYTLPAEPIPDLVMDADSSGITINYQMGNAAWTPAVTRTNTTLFRSVGTASTDDLRMQGSGQNRTLRIRPAPGLYGESNVSITITGDAGGPTTTTFKVTVNPRVVADNVLAPPGRTSTYNLTRNDTLPAPSTSVTMQTFTQGANGSVVAGPLPGTLRYTPNTGFTGADQFTYTMLYHTGAFTGTVHVTVGDWISVDLVHTDLRLDFENGAWNHEVSTDIPFGSPNVGGASNPTNLDFDEALLRVNAASVITLSASLDPVAYSFLGKAPGEQLWVLPQAQKAGVLWPGFNTEGIASGTLAAYTPSGDSRVTANATWVRLELVAARMPSGAVFSLYQSGTGGAPLVWWDTKDGINAPNEATEGGNVTDTMWINTNTHAHMNWTFTHAGRYELDVRSRAFISDGGNLVEVISGINTLHLLVIDSSTGPLVESAPTAASDSLTLTEDSGAASVNVLANDRSEPDLLEMLAVTAVTNGLGGSVSIDPGAASVSYMPLPNFSGSDSFTYTLTDEHGGSATATVNVTVNPVDDLAVWRQGFFGSPSGTGNAAPNADPDFDGLSNVLEWAFGLSPVQGSLSSIGVSGPTLLSRGTPQLGAGLQAIFIRRRFAATEGLTYAVQFSPNLSTWETSSATPVVLAQDNDYEACALPFPPFVAGQPPRFFRVQVTTSP